MRPIEAVFFWVTTGLYVLAFAGTVLGMVFRRRLWRRMGFAAVLGGLVANTGTVAARWVLSGHMPVGDRYELNVSGAWLAMLVVTGVVAAVPRLRPLLAGALPPVILALGIGVTSPTAIGPLSAAYDSGWLAVHVVFAFLSFGCFVLAFSAAAIYLAEGLGVRVRVRAGLPEGEALEEISYRVIVAGFIFEAVMIASGAVWANDLWGSYWSWDPVEVWSLISFLVYALYLHLRTFAGWRGRRSASVAVLGLVFVFLSFWGVQWLVPTVHDFNQF